MKPQRQGGEVVAIIVLDCDDVLVNLQHGYALWHNRKYGTRFDPETLDIYGIRALLGLTREENQHRFWEYHQEIEVNPVLVSPMPDAVKYVSLLARDHLLAVLSSRAWHLTPITVGTADHHFGNDTFADIRHASEGHDQVTGKDDVCLEFNADLIVDDHPKHALACAEAGIPAVLFGNYPWNREPISHPLVHRAANWQEAYWAIRGILATKALEPKRLF
jgi:uncharacterized HAD superfamily protein